MDNTMTCPHCKPGQQCPALKHIFSVRSNRASATAKSLQRKLSPEWWMP
jgi:hypothetical protein